MFLYIQLVWIPFCLFCGWVDVGATDTLEELGGEEDGAENFKVVNDDSNGNQNSEWWILVTISKHSCVWGWMCKNIDNLSIYYK